jgi:hypothetical protein
LALAAKENLGAGPPFVSFANQYATARKRKFPSFSIVKKAHAESGKKKE